MFILKKLITSILIPPGCFILILLLTGIWLWRFKQRGFACLNIVLALLLWALSIQPVSNALMAPLEAGLTIPSNPQGDVIVLLGGGIHEGVADLTGKGTPGEDMLARTVTAVRLQRQLQIPVIVSGGSGYSGRSAEAPVIRRFLLDLGVADRQIVLEEKSRDTNENALYCREILKKQGFQNPLLVTSAYHMRRSVMMFKNVGVAVTPVPAQFLTGGNIPFIWADFLPTTHSFQKSEKAIREYLGLLFYSISDIKQQL
jgi:uncharacterized SAM-binding protein YcdF (DUF218 family)